MQNPRPNPEPLNQYLGNQWLPKKSVGTPGGWVVKNLPANVGHTGSIPESGRSPGGGNGNPFQYSCLENSMDRGAWQATVHEVRIRRDWAHLHTMGAGQEPCSIQASYLIDLHSIIPGPPFFTPAQRKPNSSAPQPMLPSPYLAVEKLVEYCLTIVYLLKNMYLK